MLNFLKKKELQKIVIYACAKGEIMPLDKVCDPVFSQKLMGDGIAILVEEDTIFAPIGGTISLIAETKHAFGMTHSSGLEIMIHVGLETVNLKGEGFTPLVQMGQKVQQGDPLLRLDLDFMKKKNIELVTPIIVLNQMDKALHQLQYELSVDKSIPVLEIV